MEWVDVAAVDDVPVGTMKGFTAKGEQVLVANVDGSFYAIDAICSHTSGYLPKGRLMGKIVECPVHRAQYDVTTGKVYKNVRMVVKLVTRREARDQKSYPVKVEGGRIFVGV